ncbi:PLP-dependent lyase/thiolase [Anaerosalibacter bizertensis]|uniref:PLP-dependent lyase/thiolase n=2 Tax=Anaerosalibacter bizertensis TaxID=932217 RepID=A0A844FIF8_9FIRM|nr:2-amino-4-oxopentanoate thiolase subunit OrtB [Anaerosalibacter bizertensis]MBU5292739.1 PLP-dependent lyase/thiolase [Anaerosalibacter bizertensis]MCB5559623.1 PLP-dependent lyase/thiolase [Anaerosalibacter bizertensis]MSS43741.1 PLP-dependent lyase/thiolase [Anaerosalibacter bizertensis]HHV26869.1 PLP-dependent lyase/thiolase [Tissierellia bacterium]
MSKDMSFEAVMARRPETMKKAIGIDYDIFESGSIAFDYERMMRETGYSLQQMQKIQSETGVGNTPVYELRNLTALARKFAPEGKGARIFVKDEAANPSGSFKARRAATACYHAKKLGYKGVIAATSGNYGAAVASQAAMRGLKCIIVQECYDSREIGQPEIVEKARKCEAYGAEVVQLTVGPELFYSFLRLLEETGYFNASLYTPFGIAGVETLGYELSMEFREREGKDPDVVVVTNAGGGNLTGTARGLIKADADTQIVGASVDLSGLHMASDKQFNKKSFTTGHTGFGIPFATWPDRSDVPRSAARPLRYMDRYVTVNQGSVFYMTEALAQLEGLERGPAGNTSLAATFALAQELDEDKIIVAQETEYTGAGKHIQPQLTFAKENGIEIVIGDPKDEIPGENIVLPEDPSYIKTKDIDLNKIKRSYIRNCIKNTKVNSVTSEDIEFLVKDTKSSEEFVKKVLDELKVEY